MTYRGRVKNGVVVLDEPVTLPEGAEVTIQLPEVADAEPVENVPGESLSEFMLRFAGAIKDLPPDFAEQHDHYLHGTPKK